MFILLDEATDNVLPRASVAETTGSLKSVLSGNEYGLSPVKTITGNSVFCTITVLVIDELFPERKLSKVVSYS